MSEFKGIKGNWIIEYSNRDDSYDVYDESKDKFVCTTMNSSDIEKYNALLISKAPEMLEMLKSILASEHLKGTIEESKIKQLIKSATEG